LTAGFAAELQSDAATFTVVGLCQVDQLKVKRKGAREQNGAFNGERVDQLERLGSMLGSLFRVAAGFRIAAANGALPQRFHMLIKIVAGLLAQNFAKQGAEGPHIAAQGSFLEVAGACFKLGEPLRPAFGIPQKGHRLLIIHDWL
jgi:hypothetical protein